MPNIRVSEKTYEELVEHGNLRDTFDNVIQKLLKAKKREEIAVDI
jgi:predicted CopG family antitoxin